MKKVVKLDHQFVSKKKLDHQLLYLQKYKRVEAQFSLKFYVEEQISIINQHINN